MLRMLRIPFPLFADDMAYYTGRNWALREVQLAYDEVYRLFISVFES